MPRRLIKCLDTGECFCSYRAYLKSEHWRNFRTAYFAEHYCACSKCETSEGAIQLHHLTYARIGMELFSDVVPVCAKCHRAHYHTEITKKPKSVAKKRKKRKKNGKSELDVLRRQLVKMRQPRSIARAERRIRQLEEQAKPSDRSRAIPQYRQDPMSVKDAYRHSMICP